MPDPTYLQSTFANPPSDRYQIRRGLRGLTVVAVAATELEAKSRVEDLARLIAGPLTVLDTRTQRTVWTSEEDTK